MPDSGPVIWGATCALIVILLAMIRYTVAKGIDSILEQLRALWLKLESAEKESAALRGEFQSLRTRCDERHK